MEHNLVYYRQSLRWRNALAIALTALLLLGALGTQLVWATPDSAQRVQPALLQMAAEHPEQEVSVIVQKTVTDKSVENAVTQLDGKITKDLHIINAFAADLQAGAVLKLVRHGGIRWISLDSAVVKSDCGQCVNTTNLQSTYNADVNATAVWNRSPYLQGQNMTVAVVDSGVDGNAWDLSARMATRVKFNSNSNTINDRFGHGTHVAGVIAGSGAASSGGYIGIAPQANIVSVKVSDDQGMASTSDVVRGLQWVLDNQAAYNIKVVNVSLNSSVSQSYLVDPLDAACEILWFNRIVVVVSGGNNGMGGGILPPANDPFVISVGAVDDRGTASLSDDVVASFSAYGMTSDGFAKPDLVAPGTNIVSLLASSGDTLAQQHPANIVGSNYFKMSGTSSAAPIVAGAALLLLQDEPTLNPDQVKYRLKATAAKSTLWPGYDPARAGAGYLDVSAAVLGTTTNTANTGTLVSQLLGTGSQPLWGSVNWSSVNWSSVNWSSVNWSSVNWSSVNWSSDYWGR